MGNPLARLQTEIFDFTDYISLTVEEYHTREAAFHRLQETVNRLWPKAKCHLFGSYATGLSLSTSDIDCYVYNPMGSSNTLLSRLSVALKSDGVTDKLDLVPLIKYLDVSRGNVHVDINLKNSDGVRTTLFIKDEIAKKPMIKPLGLIIKYWLQQRCLDNVREGGLGSYAMMLSIIGFVKIYKANYPTLPKVDGLGRVLREYFNFYGNIWDYKRHSLLPGSGTIVFKEDVDAIYVKEPMLLSIMDPVVHKRDVTRSSFNISTLRLAFQLAFVDIETALNTNLNSESILGSIITITSEYPYHGQRSEKMASRTKISNTSPKRELYTITPPQSVATSPILFLTKTRRNVVINTITSKPQTPICTSSDDSHLETNSDFERVQVQSDAPNTFKPNELPPNLSTNCPLGSTTSTSQIPVEADVGFSIEMMQTPSETHLDTTSSGSENISTNNPDMMLLSKLLLENNHTKEQHSSLHADNLTTNTIFEEASVGKPPEVPSPAGIADKYTPMRQYYGSKKIERASELLTSPMQQLSINKRSRDESELGQRLSDKHFSNSSEPSGSSGYQHSDTFRYFEYDSISNNDPALSQQRDGDTLSPKRFNPTIDPPVLEKSRFTDCLLDLNSSHSPCPSISQTSNLEYFQGLGFTNTTQLNIADKSPRSGFLLNQEGSNKTNTCPIPNKQVENRQSKTNQTFTIQKGPRINIGLVNYSSEEE
ncbi:Non-canonical poly(A) RNA polymerase PAPD5 [Neolecta irregularis DAH-3]|uniref:Non-canonical poly(A) RNA polymerase PAPD5 n=1 Tax=Neolecta irregularis (strain DAH-3) TaxID=1198029 RepID=A0A1U7LKP7_NEOID|nr:Non-canonical poly(A) RNA polymerase PAPD5 [Neolecta irregularis DAH-3]|eukprot:OLL23230.1 Non-canonical poly(A) RNA polymerase PAPD5 [Neolecta irregularis DAH-3]